MAYRGTQQRVEGDAAEVLHQAGEVRQRELVAEIAARFDAFDLLEPAYHAARTSRLRCLILDAIQEKCDPRAVPLMEARLTDASTSVRGHALADLLRCRPANLLRLLLPLLSDSNSVIRCQAFAARRRSADRRPLSPPSWRAYKTPTGASARPRPGASGRWASARLPVRSLPWLKILATP